MALLKPPTGVVCSSSEGPLSKRAAKGAPMHIVYILALRKDIAYSGSLLPDLGSCATTVHSSSSCPHSKPFATGALEPGCVHRPTKCVYGCTMPPIPPQDLTDMAPAAPCVSCETREVAVRDISGSVRGGQDRSMECIRVKKH